MMKILRKYRLLLVAVLVLGACSPAMTGPAGLSNDTVWSGTVAVHGDLIVEKGARLTILYGHAVVNGLVWIEVQDANGVIGWIPQVYVLTPTASATFTPSPTTPTTPTGTSAAPTGTLTTPTSTPTP